MPHNIKEHSRDISITLYELKSATKELLESFGDYTLIPSLTLRDIAQVKACPDPTETYHVVLHKTSHHMQRTTLK